WNPGALAGRLEFLLDTDLFDKIEVCLTADRSVDLFQRPFVFGDPYRPGEREILRTLRIKVQPVAIVITDVKAVRQVVVVVESPSVRNRRDELLRDDVQP